MLTLAGLATTVLLLVLCALRPGDSPQTRRGCSGAADVIEADLVVSVGRLIRVSDRSISRPHEPQTLGDRHAHPEIASCLSIDAPDSGSGAHRVFRRGDCPGSDGSPTQGRPGPNEPDWKVILSERYGLSMFGDLLNPVVTTAEATPGLFRKAGPGPVTYTPVIALGLETRNRGGWYVPLERAGRAAEDTALELRSGTRPTT